MKRKLLNGFGKAGKAILIFLFVANVLFPIYWLLITSLKTPADIVDLNIQYIPKHITYDNYVELWSKTRFPTYTKNSIIVALLTGVLVTIIAVLGGYALARYKFRAKKGTIISFLISQMIPTTIFIIPIFIIFSKINLINTYTGLIIYEVVCNMPFCVITMESFFENIPVVLEESAALEGCNKFQILTKIVLPIMLPGIVSVFIFAFIGAWNALLGPIMLISSNKKKTIPIGLNEAIGRYTVNWGQMSSGGILALLPTLILFAFAQRYIIEGLSSGSVKE